MGVRRSEPPATPRGWQGRELVAYGFEHDAECIDGRLDDLRWFDSNRGSTAVLASPTGMRSGMEATFLVADTAFARVSTTTGAVTVAANADTTFIRPVHEGMS